MQQKIISCIICVSCVLFPCLLAAGDDVEYVTLQERETRFYVDFTVHEDCTVEKIIERETQVLTEQAARELKRQRFSHSTSIERFEILDAWTKKSDGSKIPVPEDNYQVTINRGNGQNSPVFSDRTRITVVFPDLEVNDSIYIKTKTVQTEPMFKNHFSTSYYFWDQKAYDDVRVHFTLPQSLQFQYEVRGMKERVEESDGKKMITLTYSNKKPVKKQRRDFSVWDESGEAGYRLSTFMDYQALASAYGEKAAPKALPTERVRALAKRIIGDAGEKKEQARRIYDWVTTNISYGGNCIGVGAVVPHDLDFVLDNRMGDCKDHATLINSLFAAIDVKSTQALINSGSVYTLPKIPVISSVNHVINYIPEWDMFVDSTNPSLPFDQLSLSLADKNVLLVDNFRENMKTPATQPGTNHQETVLTVDVQPDGSVTGTFALTAGGEPAVRLRSAWRHVTKESEEEWLKEIFSSQSHSGTGTMNKEDPGPLLSTYSYSIEFTRPDFLPGRGAGAFYPSPFVPTPMPVSDFLNYDNRKIEGYDVVCSNGYSKEQLIYRFPENIEILAVPDDFEIEENHLHYKSTCSLEDNTLTVVREMDDRTPGNVCSAELVNRQRQTGMQIIDHLRQQVVYRNR